MDARERYATLLWRLGSSGQWDRVLAAARDWLAEDPACTEAHQHAGQALVNLERYQEALPHVQKALAGNPGSAFLHRLASMACFQQSHQRSADHHIEEALRLAPRDPMNWYHLARMRYKSGSYDAAAKYANRARELDPDNADIINLLALCQRGTSAERMDYYTQALKMDPRNAVVLNNLGVLFLNDGKYAQAADYFRQALTINPRDKNTQENLEKAVRGCDPLYRVLRWPRVVIALFAMQNVRRDPGRAALRVLFCLFAGRFLLFAYGFWLVFGVALLRGYEWITLPDLREQTGVPGARRGGTLRFWRWPRAVRVGLYLVAYAAASAALVQTMRQWFTDRQLIETVYILAVMVCFYNLAGLLYRGARGRYTTWRGERNLRRMEKLSARPNTI